MNRPPMEKPAPRRTRTPSRSVALHLALGLLGLWCVSAPAGAQEAGPFDPSLTPGDSVQPSLTSPQGVYEADFDLGDLNRPEVSEETRFVDRWLKRVYSNALPDYLKEDLQKHSAGLPEFMAPVLAPGGRPGGDRYLSLRLRGADALLTTRKDPSRPALDVVPSTRLRWRIHARWDSLGEGSWVAQLRVNDGTIIRLHEGQGTQQDWTLLEGELILPATATSIDLEIWLNGYRTGKRAGEVGLDEISIETLPRISFSWEDSLARVNPLEEHPVTVLSHGLPSSRVPYRLEYAVLDAAGRKVGAGDKRVLVLEGHSIEFEPRLSWRRWGLPRGIYSLVVSVRPGDGAGTGAETTSLTERQSFTLMGSIPFAPGVGPTEWGVEVTPVDEVPYWFDMVQPQRVLRPLPPPDRSSAKPAGAITTATSRVTPRAWRETPVSVLFEQPDSWTPKDLPELAAELVLHRRWYWPGDDTGGPDGFVAQLRDQAPFVQLGFRLPPGETASASGPLLITPRPSLGGWGEWREWLGTISNTWSTRLDLASVPAYSGTPAHRLASAAFLLAAHAPRSVFLVEPEETLFRHSPTGEVVPRRSFLTWEFVTSFLAGAEFQRFEDWAPGVHALTFRRDGRDYVVVFTETGTRELLLNAGPPGPAWNSAGVSVTLGLAEDGRTKIPVSSDPLLVSGLDLARVRTARSFDLTSQGLIRNTDQQQLMLNLTNHYGVPLRATLSFELPVDWVAEQSLDPLRLEPGAKGEWPLALRAPSYRGASGTPELRGTVVLEAEGRDPVRVAIRREIPLESTLVDIRSVGEGPTDADIVIRNISDRALVVHVYLAVNPQGTEVTRLRQPLAVDEERSYRISYPRPVEGVSRQLLVSVSIPSERAYENRVFDIE